MPVKITRLPRLIRTCFFFFFFFLSLYEFRPIAIILDQSLSVCLNIPNFAFVYIDFMIFPEDGFGMTTLSIFA